MLIGYAYVSARDRNLDLQRKILADAGCKEIFEDRSFAVQPALAKALAALHAGDTLVVWKLDRLGCDAEKLIGLIGGLRQRGIRFMSLADAIDTETPSGSFFLETIARLDEATRGMEFEYPYLQPRRFPHKRGRKPKMSDERIELAKRLLESGTSLEETARRVGVSISTIYRWVPAPEKRKAALSAKREFEKNLGQLLTPIHKNDTQE
ncbi:MAG: recombinase family protein [Zoogloeaceae bacterium]|jgi:DNA invertase Pin-like site-specific DNA recombinase|nr:recombinase family protein [Zoogloeaceae bacterium]